MLRLDINLVFTIINLLIWYAIIRIFLFKPINKVIDKRSAAIQEKYDEAKKILRNLTYKRISNIKMSLDSYVSLSMKDNNISNAKEILNIQSELLRIFNLEDIYAIGTSLMSSEVYSKEKNIEKTLEHIEKIIDSVNHNHNLEGHLLFDGIELFEGVHSKSYVVANLKRVISEDRYDFIKNDKRYKDIILKLESMI